MPLLPVLPVLLVLLVLLVLAVLGAWPRGAAARAALPWPDEPTPPPSGMTVQGQVSVSDARLDTRCRTARQRSRCVLTLRFIVTADEAAVVTLPSVPGGDYRVDGRRVPRGVAHPVVVEVGHPRRIQLRVRHVLREARSEGLYLIAEAAWTRHALLGEFEHIRRGGDQWVLRLFEGDGWRLRGSFRVDAPPTRRVSVHADGRAMPGSVEARTSALPATVAVTLEGPRATPRWLRRGGPVFMVGSTLGGQARFFWRAGYEAGFGRHGFLQALVETDVRERLAFVLLVEGALASPLYIIPSLSAGAGLVVQTWTDPHVALRFSLGANFGVGLGAQATLDWDPRGRRTSVALAARLSF